MLIVCDIDKTVEHWYGGIPLTRPIHLKKGRYVNIHYLCRENLTCNRKHSKKIKVGLIKDRIFLLRINYNNDI